MTHVQKKRAVFKHDLALAAGIVVLVAALGAWQLLHGQSGAYAVVHDGDGGQTVLSLSENGEHVISTSLGTNVVVVEDGSVRVSAADCPNHDCVEQGTISSSSQQIVCLPHKLWIEVVEEPGAADGSALDASSR